MDEKRFTPQMAAPVLRLTDRQVRRLCEQMRIPPVRTARGPVYYITDSQLAEMKKRRKVGRPREQKEDADAI